jgi:hypothetical protein
VDLVFVPCGGDVRAQEVAHAPRLEGARGLQVVELEEDLTGDVGLGR